MYAAQKWETVGENIRHITLRGYRLLLNSKNKETHNCPTNGMKGGAHLDCNFGDGNISLEHSDNARKLPLGAGDPVPHLDSLSNRENTRSRHVKGFRNQSLFK